MPKFYFDRAGVGMDSAHDDIGQEFGDLDDARAHAMTLLPLMGMELPLKVGEFRSWTVSIRDQSGHDTVARFILAIINDQCGPNVFRTLHPV